MRRAVALLAMLFALAGSFAVAAPAGAGTDASAQLLTLTNSARSQHGLAPIVLDGQLSAVAQTWSQRMASAHVISHNPNLGQQVTQDWATLGENVGMGATVESIQQAFLNSPAHLANVLGAYTRVGIGVVSASDGTLYVALDFMDLRVAAAFLLLGGMSIYLQMSSRRQDKSMDESEAHADQAPRVPPYVRLVDARGGSELGEDWRLRRPLFVVHD